MAGNASLGCAKAAKNDEFYTQYSDVEAEMNAYVEFDPDVFRDKTVLLPCDDPEWSSFTRYFAANFARFGLRKLISTSYAKSKGRGTEASPELDSPLFDESLRESRGRLFTLERAADGTGDVGIGDIRFEGYLKGDGDFRSAEVRRLRDEADFVITNPPFSLVHDFVDWLCETDKRFIFIGNDNMVKYKEVFPLLKRNEAWLGWTRPKEFLVPDGAGARDNVTMREDGVRVASFGNNCWLTNVDHGGRHQPLLLDTREHNLRYNRKLRKRLKEKYNAQDYPSYSNFDALEVPYVECIPSDYDGVMGVPITFLDKHDPDQFELVGITGDLEWAQRECSFFRPPPKDIQQISRERNKTWRVQKAYVDDQDSLPLIPVYDRLFIRRRKGQR